MTPQEQFEAYWQTLPEGYRDKRAHQSTYLAAFTAGWTQAREFGAELARQRIGNPATKDPIEAGKNIMAATIANTICHMEPPA